MIPHSSLNNRIVADHPTPVDHAQPDDRRTPRQGGSSASSSAELYRLHVNAASSPEADKFGIVVLDVEEGRTALHLAAAKGHVDAVKAALQAGTNVNSSDSSGYTALHQAATEGYTEVVRVLLKNGAHVDAQDEMHGNTALHEAAWKGYSQTLEVLCKHKANVYIRNKGGFSALHLACQNGHNQSCRVLLLAGCKPDIRNNYGDTPLHTAARYGHAGVLRILISAFCHVSEVNKNGDTALHIAAAMGRRKLTKILLESGCNQDIKNKQGETAKDIAARKGFAELLNILNNPPQKVNQKIKPTIKNVSKKREKDSGTSQGSKENTSRHKDKHKKSKHGHQVHFPDDHAKDRLNGHFSPYGCHMFPNVASFPSPKLDSLPVDPLHKGEQYYIDLAGNIRKGPVGVGYACYCAPFFHHVEKKLEADKQDLIHHIDNAHEDLNTKIANLERRTRNQLFHLNQNMKQKLAEEKEECQERQDRRSRREKCEIEKQQQMHVETLKSEMKSWMHSIFGKSDTKRGCSHPVSTASVHTTKSNSSMLRKSKSQGEKINLMRSASIDSLSDSDADSRDNLSPVARSRAPLCLRRLGSFLQSEASDVRPEAGYVNRLRTDFEKLGARPKHNQSQCHHRQSDPMALQREAMNNKSAKDTVTNATFLQMRRDSRSEGDLTTCHKYPGSRHPYVEPYPNCSRESLNDSSNCLPTKSPNGMSVHQHRPSPEASYQSSSHHPGPPADGDAYPLTHGDLDLSVGLPISRTEESKYNYAKQLQSGDQISPASPSQGCDSGIETLQHTLCTSPDSAEDFVSPSKSHVNSSSLV